MTDTESSTPLYKHNGFVTIVVTVGGQLAAEESYLDGQELASEAFREAVVAVGKHAINVPVEMVVQYHPHDVDGPVEACTCAQNPDHGYVWRNRTAEHARRAELHIVKDAFKQVVEQHGEALELLKDQ